MSDMPESVCDWCDETDPQRQARCPVKGCGRAPLTPAEAMARCPEVAALVGVIADTAGRLQRVDDTTRNLPPEMEGLSAYECGELAAYLDRVLAPFVTS